MGSRDFALIEMVFSAAVVLGLGLWQLVSIHRTIAADKAAKQNAADPPPSPEGAGHAIGEHRLDDR